MRKNNDRPETILDEEDDLEVEDNDNLEVEPEDEEGEKDWNRQIAYFDPADQDTLRVITQSFRIRNRRLSAKDEERFIIQAQKGDAEAKQILVEMYFGLVLRCVRQHQRRCNIRSGHPMLSIEDLVQDGLIGLFNAIKGWKKQKNCRLSTYAVLWINQALLRVTDDRGRTIRLPSYRITQLSQVYKIQKTLATELEHPVTDQELSRTLDISENTLSLRLSWLEDAISLQTLLHEEDSGVELGDTVSNAEDSPFRHAYLADLQRNLSAALDNLSDQQREVLNLRFGLRDGVEYTLKEIGLRYGLSRERIRQIEKQALKTLQKQLPDLLDGSYIQ